MLVTGAIFLSIVGLKTWDEVIVQYPTQAVLAMAAGRIIPMVVWMLFQGMGGMNAYEMAGMVLPVVPSFAWFGSTLHRAHGAGPIARRRSSQCWVLMRYRRSTYSLAM